MARAWKKNPITNLTRNQILHLIQAYTHFGPAFPDKETRERAWKENKVYILSLQGKPIVDYSLRSEWFCLYERPSAYYEYDLGYVGTGHQKECTLAFENTGPMYSFGMTTPAPKCKIYSDQQEFLTKNNLLNAAEKRLI